MNMNSAVRGGREACSVFKCSFMSVSTAERASELGGGVGSGAGADASNVDLGVVPTIGKLTINEPIQEGDQSWNLHPKRSANA